MKRICRKVLMLAMAAFVLLGTFSNNGVQAMAEEVGSMANPTEDLSEIDRVFPSYPYNNDLSQTLIYKLALDYGNLEIGNPSLHQGLLTVEYTMDYIRHVDNLTRGVPKIIVLAGFQEGGHDWQYPAMGPLNSEIKSTEHPEWDGATCIRYIMEECKKYNTRATVHTNIVDAYEVDTEQYPEYDNSTFEYYKEHELLARNEDGSYVKGWQAPHGQAYNINLKASFEDPNGVRKQIAELFEMLPAIVETGVVYTDANVEMNASPYHGVTAEEQVEAYRDIISWIKNTYNVDVVGEYGLTSQYGYMGHGMTWDGGGDPASRQPMKVPAYLMAGGESHVGSNPEIELFGGSVQLEHETYHNMDNVSSRFAQKTLPYFFLNTKLREAYSSDRSFVRFSDGVKSMIYTGYVSDIADYDPVGEPVIVTTGKYLGYDMEEKYAALSDEPVSWTLEGTWVSGGYRLVSVDEESGEKIVLGTGDTVNSNKAGDRLPVIFYSEITDMGWSSIVWNPETVNETPDIESQYVVIDRLWEASSGEPITYIYETEDNRIGQGTEVSGDEYLWEIIPGENGDKIRNKKTGNYLAVTALATSEVDTTPTLGTKPIAEDGDFSGAEWSYDEGPKGDYPDYDRIHTEFEGKTVYVGNNVKDGYINSVSEDYYNSDWSSLMWRKTPYIEGNDDEYIRGEHVIAQGDNIYKIGNDIFMPVVWREKEIMAYSETGGTRTWKLPDDWSDVEKVDIYEISQDGLVFKETADVVDGTLTVTIEAGRSQTIVPAGTDTETNYRVGTDAVAEYLGTDAETSGDWKGVYGTDGYSVIGGEDTLSGKVSHIGATDVVWETADDARALFKGADSDERVAAAKTSELHQLIDVDTGGKTEKVSVYLLDYNNEGSQTLVEVIDPVTLECLTATTVNDYSSGIYVNFNITGHAQIRLTRLYNEDFSNVGAPYVAGVFFDAAGTATETSKAPVFTIQTYAEGKDGDKPGAGSAVVFKVKAMSRDCGMLSYQWQKSANGTDWTNIDGATDQKYEIAQASDEDLTTYYRCVVTNTRRGYVPAAAYSDGLQIKEAEDPTDPGEGETPDDEQKPDDGQKPDDENQNKNNVDNEEIQTPQTGDTSVPYILLVLAAAAAGAAVMSAGKKRKTCRKE